MGADGELRRLLHVLRRVRGLDFTGYKISTLERRIAKRLKDVGVADISSYIDLLDVEPEEYNELFDALLINVTSFFRDSTAWEKLNEVFLPRLPEDGPIRIWSAGCSTGEEAFTLAFILADALGIERFKTRVKIFATDLDEPALIVARQAEYPEKALSAVPEEIRERYFGPAPGGGVILPEIRRNVIFGRHDLIQDAPIGRIDLITCRNVLMYLDADTQALSVRKMHYALKEGGVLFLGKAEMLLRDSGLFRPLDLKNRVFERIAPGRVARGFRLGDIAAHGAPENLDANDALLPLAFDAAASPEIVVDASGVVALVNERAMSEFKLSARDIGLPFQDLEISYRPVELRSRLDEVVASRTELTEVRAERVRSDGTVGYVDVSVAPLIDPAENAVVGVRIRFDDVSEAHRLEGEIRDLMSQMETTAEELHATNEELETSNEELQATNEELETTNEELQATNEELETLNEELQATNTELSAINDELQVATEEVKTAYAFTTSILSSLRNALIVLDDRFGVVMWNARAQDLWGLGEEEIRGKPFFQLDIGLPVELLRAAAVSSLAARKVESIEIEALDRRGKPLHCRVITAPLAAVDGGRPGVVLSIEGDQNGG